MQVRANSNGEKLKNENVNSRPVRDRDNEPTSRQQQLERLYLTNYNAILEIVNTAHDLPVPYHQLILDNFPRHLPKYTGTVSDEAFIQWLKDFLAPRIEFWSEFDVAISKGINVVLRKCADLIPRGGRKDLVGELRQRAWLWALEHQDEIFNSPSTAPMWPRAFGIARFQTQGWKSGVLRERERRVDIDDLKQIGEDELGNKFLEPNCSADAAD
jgi:hypothetical protein